MAIQIRAGDVSENPVTGERAIVLEAPPENPERRLVVEMHARPGAWMRRPGTGAHVPPTGGVLVCAGTEPADIDYLGAEIQMDLGAEHERYVIDKPTAVVIPAGTPHNPIVTRWVDHPDGVLMMSLGGNHDTRYID